MFEYEEQISQCGIDPESQRCKDLWAAVFAQGCHDAAEDYFRQDRQGSGIRWFWSDETHPGAFIWLCDLFDRDPDAARSQIQMRFRELKRKAQGGKRKGGTDDSR